VFMYKQAKKPVRPQAETIKLIKEVFITLENIFLNDQYMDKAIEKTMRKNKRWGVKDRAFVAEATYNIVRNWRLLCTVNDIREGEKTINWWHLYFTSLLLFEKPIPEISQAKVFNRDKTLNKLEKYWKIRKLRESYPDWLDNLCQQELGARWEKLSAALNKPARMVLRANSLKIKPEELQQSLQEVNIETTLIDWSPEALELTYSRNVFRTEEFAAGLFEVQDSASQMVSEFLGVKSGMRVVDACAGTGGKTLHIAALMKNKGRIIALDNKEFKLQELRKRSARAGINIIEARAIDSTKVIKRLYDTADRVLLDVPCSGTGILRRNPDSKWKLTEEEVVRVREQQRDLLQRYSPITKVGGKMLYATCSILPSEGEEQVKWFLENNADWGFIGEKRYWTDLLGCDSFYMALLERKK